VGDVRVSWWDRARQALTGRTVVIEPSAEIERYAFDEYLRERHMLYGGVSYPLTGFTMSTGKAESIADSFAGYVQGAYRSNGVIFAVSMARALLFCEARFKFRRYGDPGGSDLFGTPELRILERPWPGGSTAQLLMRAEQDITSAGTFFVAREGDRLRRLRPDWTEFILSAPPDEALAADIVGIKHTVGGVGTGGEVSLYPVGEFAHWAPIPDPLAQYRGMSWLTPVLQEIRADGNATDHKLKFFENAATPNLAVSLKETVTEDQFRGFKRAMDEAQQGVSNAYKTLYLGGGADVKVVGADLRQLDFKQTQGAGETRIAAAGRVPPIIVGLSEGLQAATYSNYGQARRAFGDHWGRPQWRSFCEAMSALVNVPDGAELWVDDRDIAFLREDRLDVANIQAQQATTIRTLGDAGYEPESIVKAVLAEDFSLLKHSGMFSVQLQPPGAADPAAEDPTASPDATDPAAEAADAAEMPG
jgi:hypothetical protein